MAKEVLEMEVKSNIKSVTKDTDGLGKSIGKASDNTKDLGKSVNKSEGGIKKLAVGFGTLMKATGFVFLITKAFEILKETLGQNQKVVDFFAISMTTLRIAFNDLFKFIENNIGTVVGYFKDIFENPQQSLKDFGTAIKENLIERFESLMETFGHLGKALKHLFKGEFEEAWESAKDAGTEYVDVLTGVDNSVDKITETVKTAAAAVKDYTKSTIEQAIAIENVNKAAGRAEIEFAKLNAEFLKEAEVQRQIRDDVSKTFAVRIAANEELSKVLEKQSKAQKEQIEIKIAAAQAQYNMNASEENFLLLEGEKVALLELEETITGQISEQKTNQVALEIELRDAQAQTLAEGLAGIERELLELETAYELKLDLANKAGMATTAITEQYEKEKQAIIDAASENNSALAKKEIDTAKAVADAKKASVNDQLSAAAGLAGALSSLAGDNKTLAVGSAIIDTYVGANKAFAQGGTVGFVTAAAVIASGLKNVQTILSTDVGGGGGGGGGGSAPQTPAPQMMSGQFELGGGVAPEPLKAFVVTDEMSNSQNQLANIRRRATI